VGIGVRKMVAVGHLVRKYDEIICSIHQGGHPASHHDPPVGGPWWGSFAKTTGRNKKADILMLTPAMAVRSADQAISAAMARLLEVRSL
jgi:hypothetical protein